MDRAISPAYPALLPAIAPLSAAAFHCYGDDRALSGALTTGGNDVPSA